jgi:ribosome recycling factor
MENLQELLLLTTKSLEKAYEQAKKNITKVATFRASPDMVKDIHVNYHGVSTPIQQIATIHTPDASTIQITPWEKKLLHEIERAIVKDNQHDLNPHNTGEIIRINLPNLTEERRRELIKKVNIEIENLKVRVRAERKAVNQHLKNLIKEGVAEDEIKRTKDAVQNLIDKYIQKADELQTTKAKELMTI